MHLFAYGSLMHPEVFLRVVGEICESEVARLSGHERRRLKGRDYPGLRPISDVSGVSRVDGTLYYALPAAAWGRLDRFEGSMYERRTVIVETDGGMAPAETFVLADQYAFQMSDEPWTYEWFLEKGFDRFCRMYLGFGRL